MLLEMFDVSLPRGLSEANWLRSSGGSPPSPAAWTHPGSLLRAAPSDRLSTPRSACGGCTQRRTSWPGLRTRRDGSYREPAKAWRACGPSSMRRSAARSRSGRAGVSRPTACALRTAACVRTCTKGSRPSSCPCPGSRGCDGQPLRRTWNGQALGRGRWLDGQSDEDDAIRSTARGHFLIVESSPVDESVDTTAWRSVFGIDFSGGDVTARADALRGAGSRPPRAARSR